ncbi:uncharacterized protein LOC125383195 [Haliotis rufescens]|uniref:uncharacterized protein LOC125383195 n=1 Tax=Haliotis rufescens TaxID=6454 RepID=UPI00201F73BD|nr:uncharacterized protein LOC125383195 [Haliotis rufescens]
MGGFLGASRRQSVCTSEVLPACQKKWAASSARQGDSQCAPQRFFQLARKNGRLPRRVKATVSVHLRGSSSLPEKMGGFLGASRRQSVCTSEVLPACQVSFKQPKAP